MCVCMCVCVCVLFEKESLLQHSSYVIVVSLSFSSSGGTQRGAASDRYGGPAALPGASERAFIRVLLYRFH